jgi:RNA polymerase sigma factor (sigma-70 family)
MGGVGSVTRDRDLVVMDQQPPPGGPAVPATARYASFEDFYRAEYRFMMSVAVAVGGSLDDADDAVDHAMEQVWRGWSRIDNPRAYARRAVLTTVVKQRVRDRQRLPRSIEGGHVTPEGADCPELTMWEDRQWVAQLLATLPPAQREVMDCVLAGLTTTEISQLLGSTPAAVRKNLQHAREKLKRQLDDTPRAAAGREPVRHRPDDPEGGTR